MGLSVTAAELKIDELLKLGLSGDELKTRLVSEGKRKKGTGYFNGAR